MSQSQLPESRINGLYLFKSLIKDGCKWQGDIVSFKWSECLYYDDNIKHQIALTLEVYSSGVDYVLEDGCIWLA